MNDMAPIGHNGPPTPFDEASAIIETTRVEALGWLDGEAITNQNQADTVSTLINDIRKARKVADDARKAEARPFDDGKKEVQARYKPLLETADTMADGCKRLLAPFLEKVEAEKRAKAEAERAMAEAAQAAAQKAAREAEATDLAAREEAERLIKEAKVAEAAAKRAENDRASGKGVGRAVTLRTVYRSEITDLTEAARHYWKTDRGELQELIENLVARDVREGRHTIPGVVVHEDQVAQ